MKNISLITLFIIPIIVSAQSDDYCPCQEDLKNQAEIFDFVSSVNNELYIQVSQNTVTAFTPAIVPEEVAIPIVLIPEKETIEIEKEPTELDSEDLIAEIQARNEAREAKFKRVKKRSRKKLKRSKRTKKYKGKCPFF